MRLNRCSCGFLTQSFSCPASTVKVMLPRIERSHGPMRPYRNEVSTSVYEVIQVMKEDWGPSKPTHTFPLTMACYPMV